ncbi:MAG: hypothetical protein R3A44_33120 [Caldilineaceae bacterium]
MKDQVFAPLDADLHLERIAGGNETEVFCTDDRRYVVKVKSAREGLLADALAEAQLMRAAAAKFAADIGPQHEAPNHFILSRDSAGHVHPIAIQPYFHHARALFDLDYQQLTKGERYHIARQLLHIIGRALIAYFKTGQMPDLYGRSSPSKRERERLNKWYMFPRRLWSFLVQRNLLRSHNLMWIGAPEKRIILVDYDPMKHGRLYQWVYYQVRLLLFIRDIILIQLMLSTGRTLSPPT